MAVPTCRAPTNAGRDDQWLHLLHPARRPAGRGPPARRDGRFDYLLIEGTGIAEPLPIAATFEFRDETGRQPVRCRPARHDGDGGRRGQSPAPTIRARFPARARRDARADDEAHAGRSLSSNRSSSPTSSCSTRSRCPRRSATGAGRRIVQRSIRMRASSKPISVTCRSPFSIPAASTSSEGPAAPALAQGALRLRRPCAGDRGIRHRQSFVYRARRPFDPSKLQKDFLAQEWPGLIRAKGHFWLATRPDWVGMLSIAGTAAAGPRPRASGGLPCPRRAGRAIPEFWKALDRHWQRPGAIAGRNSSSSVRVMDEGAIRAALDACLIGDETIASTRSYARDLRDPFPAWPLETIMRPLSLLSSLAISAVLSSLPAFAHDHAVLRGRLVFADHEETGRARARSRYRRGDAQLRRP
jgi:hypothetical protein